MKRCTKTLSELFYFETYSDFRYGSISRPTLSQLSAYLMGANSSNNEIIRDNDAPVVIVQKYLATRLTWKAPFSIRWFNPLGYKFVFVYRRKRSLYISISFTNLIKTCHIHMVVKLRKLLYKIIKKFFLHSLTFNVENSVVCVKSKCCKSDLFLSVNVRQARLPIHKLYTNIYIYNIIYIYTNIINIIYKYIQIYTYIIYNILMMGAIGYIKVSSSFTGNQERQFLSG